MFSNRNKENLSLQTFSERDILKGSFQIEGTRPQWEAYKGRT